MALFGNGVFENVMRSYWSRVSPNPIWLEALYEDDMKTQGVHDDRDRDWRDAAASQERPKIKSHHQKLRREKDELPPTGFRGSMALLAPFRLTNFRLLNSKFMRIHFCCFKSFSLR